MSNTVTLNLRATWQDASCRAYASGLAELEIALPVSEQRGEIGEIVDATGRSVLQVDPLGIRSDEDVSAISAAVTLAINMAGGFRQSDLDAKVAAANARLNAMTSEQRAEHDQAQRESFVRSMTTPCEHGTLDFEQCPHCRGAADA